MATEGNRPVRGRDFLSPFTCSVPSAVRQTLIQLQYRRFVAALPLLGLLVAANSVAMGVAVYGQLPLWQQLAPPVIIVGTCLAILFFTRRLPQALAPAEAEQFLRKAPLVAVPLGLVAGAWCINAFDETEQYYCMVAPVFIGIAALITATCLNAVPRAAVAAMLATVLPIVGKLVSYEYIGLRAMAVMMLLMCFMQARVVLGRFEETVQVLVYQADLNRLAESDPLTGLDNRLRFDRMLAELKEGGAPFALLLADLDGFKAVNDRHGHLAGDAVLVEVAQRLRKALPAAASVARLGGDEFAVLAPLAGEDAQGLSQAIRTALNRGHVSDGLDLPIASSLGCALYPADAVSTRELKHLADERLYADKARNRMVRADVPDRTALADVA